MINLEGIKGLISKEKTIEDVLEKFDWREFEKIVSEIFERNNFEVKKNFRFKTNRRYEIDILAMKRDFVLVVDCKEWSGGRYKKTALRYAVDKQENRVRELKKFLDKNPIAKNLLKIKEKVRFIPLIVTLLEESLLTEGNTIIVPVWKLNSFLLDIENYLNTFRKE